MSLTITLRNLSNQTEISDYHYEISAGAKVIESGYVRGHARSDGWDGLLLKLAYERDVFERYAGPGAVPSRAPDPSFRPARAAPPKKGK